MGMSLLSIRCQLICKTRRRDRLPEVTKISSEAGGFPISIKEISIEKYLSRISVLGLELFMVSGVLFHTADDQVSKKNSKIIVGPNIHVSRDGGFPPWN